MWRDKNEDKDRHEQLPETRKNTSTWHAASTPQFATVQLGENPIKKSLEQENCLVKPPLLVFHLGRSIESLLPLQTGLLPLRNATSTWYMVSTLNHKLFEHLLLA